MRSLLELQIDGEVVLQFDRNQRLPGRQRDFLDKMDEDMDQGIRLAEEQIARPDKLQRGRYVALHLLQAYQENNQGMITATASYLTHRLPQLKSIRVESLAGEFHLQLISDG